MQAVEVKNVSKSYSTRKVVDDVSFSVSSREILGLIGPNGAGKTTNIRMIMDIIKPDSGEVLLYGQKFSNDLKDRIGYLPEERGLYRKKPIIESLVYLATLKGIEPGLARTRAEEWLMRVNMQAHKNKKIEELSHGMAQLIQLLTTIIHDPQVMILDEPFNGLDPVNVKMVKDIILDLKNKGKAIILSTHRMNEVEELCDRVFMINKGRSMLYGSLGEVKAKYRNNSVIVEYQGNLGEFGDLRVNRENGHRAELFLKEGMDPQQMLEQLVSRKIRIDKFEVSTPSLNEIFIKVVGGQK
jgi:ABC-2 type transport system ATP-binding protein